MGWGSGTGVFVDIWTEVRKHLPKEDYVKVGVKIVKILENYDWDNVGELEDAFPEMKQILEKVHPDCWCEDEE